MRKSIVTILGPTSPVYDLITVDHVNAALGLDSNTANDGATAQQITVASRLIADICNREFARFDVSETFRLSMQTWTMPHRHWIGPAYPTLMLSAIPVNEIDSITVGGSLIDPGTYDIDKEAGLLYQLNWNWTGDVVVLYSGGYDLPDSAPPLLQQACIQAIAAARRAASEARHNPYLRETQHTDTRVMYFDYQTTKGAVGPMPQVVLDLLDAYIRRPV